MTDAKALMIQGTGSDVGKSLIVAGLARAYTRRGLTVRPFKPQNMSNNAAVTVDGGEIGRAQALQARACGVAPSVDMNPVLLKPQTDVGSQVVVRGQVFGNATAADYHALKPKLLPEVLKSFESLKSQADLVLCEGAGSPAEINLRQGDIANMGFAIAAAVPVILAGDISRGGVIANLVGTKAVLEPEEAARIKGFLVNKFRGDPALFADGMTEIERRTGWSGLGLIPWCDAAARLPAEDGVALENQRKTGNGPIRIAVLRLSRIANFDDFDPLSAEPDVSLTFIEAGQAIPGDCDLVILPGSKATLADLAYLKAQGWDVDLTAHIRRGGRVLGICAGYQMLGLKVVDAEGIEGAPGEAEGLGHLDVLTAMTGTKTLTETTVTHTASGTQAQGYEMHMGTTSGPASADGGWLGTGSASSKDGQILGCYLHGMFSSDAFRRAFLAELKTGRTGGIAYEQSVENALDDLADHLEAHVDLDTLLTLAE